MQADAMGRVIGASRWRANCTAMPPMTAPPNTNARVDPTIPNTALSVLSRNIITPTTARPVHRIPARALPTVLGELPPKVLHVGHTIAINSAPEMEIVSTTLYRSAHRRRLRSGWSEKSFGEKTLEQFGCPPCP